MTPDEMRAKAQELAAGARARLAEAGLSPEAQNQISITVDQVAAVVLGVTADAIEAMQPMDEQAAKVKAVLEQSAARHNALRVAAARGQSSGDWSEYDRIVNASSGDAGGSGDS